MIRRINITAGPGVGKTTFAALVFSALKAQHFDVEHITEYIKTWAHEGRVPQSYDQFYIFAKQLKSEDLILRSVDHLVTDCPLPLIAAYANFYDTPAAIDILSIVEKFNETFPAVHILLERTVPYTSKGRFHSEAEALEFDEYLQQFLTNVLELELIPAKIEDSEDVISKIVESLYVSNHSGVAVD